MILRLFTAFLFFISVNILDLSASYLADGTDERALCKLSSLFHTGLFFRPEPSMDDTYNATIFENSLKPIGFVDCTLTSEKNVHINFIKIFEEGDMNKGHGSRVLKMLFLMARKMDFDYITLEVSPNNDNARYVYNKLGFREVESADKENACGRIFMRKKLRNTKRAPLRELLKNCPKIEEL